MDKGIHGLPKVSTGSTMPDPSLPCGQATHDTALRPFLRWPAHRAGGLQPSSAPLDTLRRTGLAGRAGRGRQVWRAGVEAVALSYARKSE